MEDILSLFNIGVEGYKTYEAKEFANKLRADLFKLLTLLVAMYFIYKIVRG